MLDLKSKLEIPDADTADEDKLEMAKTESENTEMQQAEKAGKCRELKAKSEIPSVRIPNSECRKLNANTEMMKSRNRKVRLRNAKFHSAVKVH